jgi:hypothetical protein
MSVHPWRKLLPVQSAFGSFGTYKVEMFLNSNFDSLGIEPGIHCEHVDLHFSRIDRGGKLFVNPAMVDSYFNEYSLNKYKIIRFLKELRKFYSA